MNVGLMANSTKDILILGQNPSGAKAFKNNSIDRLSTWLSFANIKDYDFDNVSKDIGHNFKVDLKHVEKVTKGYKRIVALGAVASHSLKKLGIYHLHMPHPSPRNRQLNCKKFEKQKMKELRDWVNS